MFLLILSVLRAFDMVIIFQNIFRWWGPIKSLRFKVLFEQEILEVLMSNLSCEKFCKKRLIVHVVKF